MKNKKSTDNIFSALILGFFFILMGVILTSFDFGLTNVIGWIFVVVGVVFITAFIFRAGGEVFIMIRSIGKNVGYGNWTS